MEYRLTRDIGTDLLIRWEIFVAGQQTGSLMQCPFWKELFVSKMQGWLFFWGQEGDQIRLTALIREKKLFGLGKEFFIDRGPVCDNESLLLEGIKGLLPLLIKENAIGLRLNPYWEYPSGEKIETGLQALGFEPFQRKEDRHFETLTIDLLRAEEEIFKGFRKTTRYEIKKAKQIGVSIKKAQEKTELKDFFRLLELMSREKGIGIPTFLFFQRLWNMVLKHQRRGVLLMSYLGDQLISGVIILRHGQRAVYTWGASAKGDQEKISKTHLGIWEGILWARGNGCTLFDMGGYTGGGEDLSSLNRIDLFKKGFGGEFRRLVKIHRYIFQKNKEKWLRPFI